MACYAAHFLPKYSWVRNNGDGMLNIWEKVKGMFIPATHFIKTENWNHFSFTLFIRDAFLRKNHSKLTAECMCLIQWEIWILFLTNICFNSNLILYSKPFDELLPNLLLKGEVSSSFWKVKKKLPPTSFI